MFLHASATVHCIWASTTGNTFRGRFIWLQRKADSKAIWLLNLLDCTGLNFHWFCSQRFTISFLYCSTSFGILSPKKRSLCRSTEMLLHWEICTKVNKKKEIGCIPIEKHCFLLYTVQNKSHLHEAKPFLVGWCKLSEFIRRGKLLSVEAD